MNLNISERCKRAFQTWNNPEIHRYKKIEATLGSFLNVAPRDRVWLSNLSGSQETADNRESLPRFKDRLVRVSEQCTLSQAILLALSIPLSVLAIDLALVGLGFAEPKANGELLSAQLTFAEVIGAVAGIVFAVLIFSAQNQSNRAADDLSLLSFSFRRSKLMGSAAVVLGSILAILVAPSLSFFNCNLSPQIAIVQTLLLIIFVSVVLLANIWNTLRVTSSDFFSEIKEGIRSELSVRKIRQIEFERRANLLTGYLSDAGFGLGNFLLAYPTGQSVEIRAIRSGIVSDIDIGTFNPIRELIRREYPQWHLVFCASIFSTVDSEDVICFLERVETEEPNFVAAIADSISAEQSENQPVESTRAQDFQPLIELVRNAFKISKNPQQNTPFDEVVGQLIKGSAKRIRNRDIDEASERTDLILEILEEWSTDGSDSSGLWLSNQHTEISLFDESIERTLLPIAKAVIRSNNVDTVREFFLFFSRVMRLGIDKHDLGLFHGSWILLRTIYGRTVCDEVSTENLDEFKSAISHKIDDYCWLSLDYLCITSPDHFQARYMEFVPIFLSAACGLIRDAVLAGRADDACNFHDRLFRHLGHRDNQGQAKDEISEIRNAIHFTNILITGWISRILTNPNNHDAAVLTAANSLLERAKAIPREGNELLRIWELYLNEDRIDRQVPLRNLLVRLRTEDWKTERDTQRRSMVVEGHWIDERWRLDGLRILLLAANSFAHQEFDLPPHVSHYFWDPEAELLRLNQLVEFDWIGIHSDSQPQKIQQVMGAIRQRAATVRRRDLMYVVNAPIDISIIDEIGEELELAAESPTEIHRLIQDLGMGEPPASIIPNPAIRSFNASKDQFINNPVHNVINFSGTVVGQADRQRLFMPLGAAEYHSPSHTESVALEGLREMIESLLPTLDFSPNMIVIPNTDECARAIFQGEAGQRTSDHECVYHDGIWQGINIVSFPYRNPSNILLIDSKTFFTRHSPTQVFDFEVQGPDEETVAQALNDADSGDPFLVPSDSAIQVVCDLTINPEIAIGDVNAALKIPLAFHPESN